MLSSPLPRVALMHPTQIPQPFHRLGWVYEEKYDGWRMVAYKRGDQVQLVSRPVRDHTSRFPVLLAAIAALRPATLILDGEVCIFDQQTDPALRVAPARQAGRPGHAAALHGFRHSACRGA